jgi:hypothetical protein
MFHRDLSTVRSPGTTTRIFLYSIWTLDKVGFSSCTGKVRTYLAVCWQYFEISNGGFPSNSFRKPFGIDATVSS